MLLRDWMRVENSMSRTVRGRGSGWTRGSIGEID
jgi:hypothetical protein